MRLPIPSALAAAALLAPLAASWIPQQALAASSTAPAISAVALNSDAGFSPGATLRVQVTATAQASRATLALGDSGIEIPLHQQAPGSYTGSYVVRRADHIDPGQRMVARLAWGERTATRQFNYPPSFQALAARAERRGSDDVARAPSEPPVERVASRDARPPRITELAPANGERISDRGRAVVGARLADEGSGIDPAGVRVRLNGRDVTADARITPEDVRFRADLDPGRYTVEVAARDRAGNTTTKTWTFDVADRDRDRMADSAGLPLQVRLRPGDAVADGALRLHGRTVPLANVRVQVRADPGGMPVADLSVQADEAGRFAIAVPNQGPTPPGTRYDVRVTASDGQQSAQERLLVTLTQG